MMFEGVHAITFKQVPWATVDYNNFANAFPTLKMVWVQDPRTPNVNVAPAWMHVCCVERRTIR